jgi:hypothetical protein
MQCSNFVIPTAICDIAWNGAGDTVPRCCGKAGKARKFKPSWGLLIPVGSKRAARLAGAEFSAVVEIGARR